MPSLSSKRCPTCSTEFRASRENRKYCSEACMRRRTRKENELRRSWGRQVKRILMSCFAGDALYHDFLTNMTPSKLLKFLLTEKAPKELCDPVGPFLELARKSYEVG